MGIIVFHAIPCVMTVGRNCCKNNEKIYSFFIELLGITIKIIKNPTSSDLDSSHSIDSKEALFLGFALSLDSSCCLNGLLVSFFDI